jgi:hypothetical protein
VTSFTPARCGKCGKETWWVMTRHEKWQMLDPNPSFTEGDIVVVGRGKDARAVVLTEAEQNDGQRRYRFFAHAGTCRPTTRQSHGVMIYPPRSHPLPQPSGVTR